MFTVPSYICAVVLTDARMMRDKYSPWLLSAKGKALVLLASAGLLGAGIYGVTQVQQRGIEFVSFLRRSTRSIY